MAYIVNTTTNITITYDNESEQLSAISIVPEYNSIDNDWLKQLYGDKLVYAKKHVKVIIFEYRYVTKIVFLVTGNIEYHSNKLHIYKAQAYSHFDQIQEDS